MTIQTHTVLQKLCLGIKITTQGNYFTLIIICYEHQNKLKYIFYELYIDKVIRRVHQFMMLAGTEAIAAKAQPPGKGSNIVSLKNCQIQFI